MSHRVPRRYHFAREFTADGEVVIDIMKNIGRRIASLWDSRDAKFYKTNADISNQAFIDFRAVLAGYSLLKISSSWCNTGTPLYIFPVRSCPSTPKYSRSVVNIYS